jgi:sugar lactone lactonase YvrE
MFIAGASGPAARASFTAPRGGIMRGIALIAANLLAMQALCAADPRSLGQTETVLELRPLIDISEGIAIDHRGHIFISNARLENDKRVCEILERAPDGTVSTFATLEPVCEDSFPVGVAGLAFDARGNLYAALNSFRPATHGVWRIRRRGDAERLAGSRAMPFANALAFDARGNLYVTDSIGGAVWRFPPEERGRVWIRHPFLAPDPLIGANGITFVPPNNLYVANLDRALIARIRIRPDGTPAEPEVVAAGYELLGIDGLTADAHGTLFAAIVVSVALGTSPLVRVDPETGRITSATAAAEAFDLPTSLAFGRGPLDHKSVYVVNSGLFPEGRPEAAPGIVRVKVGATGANGAAGPP